MDKTSPLIIGSAVTCEDGACATLSGLVVDATTLQLTALIVGGAVEPARLVPVELISGVYRDRTGISCSATSIRGLEPAPPGRVLDVSQDTGGWGLLSVAYWTDSAADTFLRRRERVVASDGPVGRVHGCRIAATGYPGRLMALLIDVGDAGEAHIVEVPTRAITSMKGVVMLDMTKQTVRDMPTARL